MPSRMYCPKCERMIKKERIEEIREELKKRFKSESLERGLCPVCGTPLIDKSKEREGRSAP